MISQNAQNLLNYSAANGNLWALPNTPGIGSLGLTNNLLVNGKTYLERNQTDFKTNWNPTSKLSTFVRFGWGNNYWTTPTMFGILGGPGMSQTNTAQGYGGDQRLQRNRFRDVHHQPQLDLRRTLRL